MHSKTLPPSFVPVAVIRCVTNYQIIPGKGQWEVATLERADKARTALAEEMLAGFTAEERERLRSLLQRVLDSLLSATPEQVRS